MKTDLPPDIRTTWLLKLEQYALLIQALSPVWRSDLQMAVDDPERWEQVRQLDDWLVEFRDDPRVGEEQYRRNCDRLAALYGPPVDGEGVRPDQGEIVA